MAKRRQGLTPAQVNYQPLQLENFAQPLAQMQQRYDKTVNAFEDSEFGISGLSPDSARGKELSNKLAKDRDEVLEELKRTKNYKQAAKRLKKLNKTYNEDPEISGIRQQRANYEQALEKQKEKLKKGDITETDFKNWQNLTLYKYNKQKGYGFDREAGVGKNIYIPKLEENIENDIFEAFTKLGKDIPASKITELRELKDKFGISEGQWKSIVEIKDGQEVAERIYNVFSQSHNFRDYLQNRAEYDWFNKSTTNPNFAYETIGKQIKNIDAQIQQIKNISDPRISEEEKNKAIQSLRDSKEKFNKKIVEANKSGNLNKFAENVYKSNYVEETLKPLAQAAGEAFAYKEIDRSTKGYRDSGSSGGGSLNKTIENKATLTSSIGPANTNISSTVGTGTSSATTEIQRKYEGATNELHTEISSIQKDVLQLNEEETNNDIFNIKRSFNNKTADKISSTYENFDNEIEEIETEIENRNSFLNSEKGSQGERNKKRQELEQLQSKLISTSIQKEGIFNYLESLFDASFNKGNWNSELKKIYQKEGVKGISEYVKKQTEKSIEKEKILAESIENNFDISKFSEFFNNADNYEEFIQNKNYLSKNAKEKLINNLQYKEEFAQLQELFESDIAINNPGFQHHLNSLKSLEKSAIQKTSENDTESDVEKVYYNTVKEWQQTMSLQKTSTVEEIVSDDKFKSYVGEENYKAWDEMLTKLKSGDPSNFKVVNFDPSTGQLIGERKRDAEGNIINQKEGTKFDYAHLNPDKDLYNLENPRYAGQLEGGSNVVFRVAREDLNLREIYGKVIGRGGVSENYASVIHKYKKYKKGETTLEDLNTENPTDMAAKDMIEWEKNNPESMYVMAEGSSAELMDGAENTLVGTTKAGFVSKDKQLVQNSLESYSKLSILSEPQLRKDYNEMVTTLRVATDKKDSDIGFTQPPHTWRDNGDGTKTGYSVRFTYSNEENLQQPVARVYKLTQNEKGDLVNGGYEQIEAIPITDLVTPTIIKQISLYYGVGAEIERVYDNEGRSFVPAFQSETTFGQLNSQ